MGGRLATAAASYHPAAATTRFNEIAVECDLQVDRMLARHATAGMSGSGSSRQPPLTNTSCDTCADAQ